MEKIKNFNDFLDEGRSSSMFDSKEQENVRMIQAKWSNAVLAQDAKGMEKYMKELVKANDAYIKKIKSEK